MEGDSVVKIESKTFKFKPKEKCLRVIYSDGAFLNKMDHANQHPAEIFCVIGPFENHTDKTDLMNAIDCLVRGYNLEEK